MIECGCTSESSGELLEVSTLLLEIQTSVGNKAWGSDCMCPSGDSNGTGPLAVFGSWSPMPPFDWTVWDTKTQHGTCPTSRGKWVGPLHRLYGLNPKLILLFQATYSQILKMGQEAWPRVWLWFSPALGFLLIPKLWLGMVPVSGAWRGRDSRAEILQGKENCKRLFSRSTGVSQWRAPGSKDDSDTSFIFHFRRKGRERLPSKGGDRVEKGQSSVEGARLRKSHTIQHSEERGSCLPKPSWISQAFFWKLCLNLFLTPHPQNHLSLGIHCSFSPFPPSHHIFHCLLSSSLFIYLFVWFYFCLHWVFGAVHGLSLLAVSAGYSSLRCASFLWWLLLWRL